MIPATMQLSAFGQTARAIRMRCNLSLKQMADAMSIGSAHMSAIEFGQKPLDGGLQALAIQFLSPYATQHELEVLALPPGGDSHSSSQSLVQAFAGRLKSGQS